MYLMARAISFYGKPASPSLPFVVGTLHLARERKAETRRSPTIERSYVEHRSNKTA